MRSLKGLTKWVILELLRVGEYILSRSEGRTTMAQKKVYLGGNGPFIYDDADVYPAESPQTKEALYTDGDIVVGGKVTAVEMDIEDLSIIDMTVSGTLTTQNQLVHGDIVQDTAGSVAQLKTVSVGESLSVEQGAAITGDTSITGGLTVTGDITLAGNVNVLGDIQQIRYYSLPVVETVDQATILLGKFGVIKDGTIYSIMFFYEISVKDTIALAMVDLAVGTIATDLVLSDAIPAYTVGKGKFKEYQFGVDFQIPTGISLTKGQSIGFLNLDAETTAVLKDVLIVVGLRE
jgi:hypothetical protein